MEGFYLLFFQLRFSFLLLRRLKGIEMRISSGMPRLEKVSLIIV